MYQAFRNLGQAISQAFSPQPEPEQILATPPPIEPAAIEPAVIEPAEQYVEQYVEQPVEQALRLIDGQIVFNKNFPITSQQGNEVYVDGNCRKYTKCKIPAKKNNFNDPKYNMRYKC